MTKAARKRAVSDDVVDGDDPMTAVFFALGDPTRLRLVRRLGRGPALSVAQLADELPVTRQAVSKHLRVLQGAGLVTPTKRGREQLYVLEAGRVDDARAVLDGISAGWDRALARLKALVEDT
ncbi:MAG TPA: metalloregulator ArsR/SmtB family transcription factor [Myxococcota bacterium]